MARKASAAIHSIYPATLTEPPAPPAELGDEGRRVWSEVQAEYCVQDSGGREILRQACLAVDRAHECAQLIREHGLLIDTPNGKRENPLIRAELNARAFAVRAIQKVGVGLEAIKPIGRPGYA
jgi:hypothetical protein